MPRAGDGKLGDDYPELRFGPQLSSRFPDLSLPDQHGRLIDLHRHRAGRPALVLTYRSAEW